MGVSEVWRGGAVWRDGAIWRGWAGGGVAWYKGGPRVLDVG